MERFSPPVAISDRKVAQTLRSVVNDDLHYDDWLKVGMALYHQFEGAEEGLRLWDEWSRPYDPPCL
ncbi:MAG: PriCT-2 domain-containing protein [Pseudomonadota bacterium]